MQRPLEANIASRFKSNAAFLLAIGETTTAGSWPDPAVHCFHNQKRIQDRRADA